MSSTQITRIRTEESGIALVEIMVSAAMLIIVAVGVFTAFDAGTRATSEERHRARAHSLAEADIERMRAMRIADLAGLDQTRTETQDGFDYTLRSRSEFATETASTSTCTAGTGSNDYLKVSSTVTWGSIGSRPPVVVTSLVAPPNGSIVPNSGSLLVSVEDAASDPIQGVSLSGSGAGSFSGTTGPTGCVLWRNLPAGNYSMSISGVASGKVDQDGNPPDPQTVSIVAESTNTVTLLFGDPGSIEVPFATLTYGNSWALSSADSVIVDHTGMTTARVFPPTPLSSPAPSISTGSTLFPFTSPYAIYAGVCGANNPGEGWWLATSTVPPGGTGSVEQFDFVLLPALHLTVWKNTNFNNSGPVQNAQVKIRDTDCGNFLRNFSTTTEGRLADPGLPFSTYNVCVSGVASNGQTRRRTTTTDVKDVADPTELDLFLRGGGSQSGTCP